MSIQRCIFLYLIAIIFTIFSIFFLDRILAELASQTLGKHWLFEYFTHIPKLLELITIFCALAYLFPRWRHTQSLHQLTIHLNATLILTLGVRYITKWVFGRTWPQTWKENNPSWLHNGVEGFFPFKTGVAYSSFPSGHAMVTFALCYILWHHYPKMKWIWLSMITLSLLGQLGQYYHYLGDLCAGAIFGCLCAQLVLQVLQIYQHKQ